ncbi:MAG: hypothetical protein KKD39_01245, partial [Candidatus Altiarchaeota archaeon]|nr:hypothetical protein [Candidatus Altiarchaeota archaeon]
QLLNKMGWIYLESAGNPTADRDARLAMAVEAFRASITDGIDNRPVQIDSQLGLGITQQKQGKLDEARETLVDVVANISSSPEQVRAAVQALGAPEREKPKVDAEEHKVPDATEKAKEHLRDIFQKAQTLRDAGTRARDIPLYEKALAGYRTIISGKEYSPDQKANAAYEMGMACLEAPQPQTTTEKERLLATAASSFQYVLREHPTSDWAGASHLGLGLTYKGQRNRTAAREELRRGIAREALDEEPDYDLIGRMADELRKIPR